MNRKNEFFIMEMEKLDPVQQEKARELYTRMQDISKELLLSLI